MHMAVSVLAILFGLLHLIAAATRFNSDDPATRGFAIAMACGGLCVILAAIFHLTLSVNVSDASTAGVGCLLICAAAYANGRYAGNVRLSHHIIRGIAAVLLVIGFVLW